TLRIHPRIAGQDCDAGGEPAAAHGSRSRLHVAVGSPLNNVSISLRLTFWLSAIFLCGFVLFGVAMWLDSSYSLSQGRDRTLTRRAARFVDLLEATRGEAPAARLARLEQLADVIPEGNLIHFFESSGRGLSRPRLMPPDFPGPAVSGREV